MIYKIVRLHLWITIYLVLLGMISVISVYANDRENNMVFGESGEYGAIYGAGYDPENGNTTKWLTIEPGDNGVRIIGENNEDVLMVDKYGGVYINGTLYVNGQEYAPASPGMFSPNDGFLYFLIITSLGVDLYLLYKIRK